ncbi:MAG: hypothetical protein J7L42_02510 [Elusimicrobia bacterium]|nr:hypothetical protein [Elusimicrobiota bacterium]
MRRVRNSKKVREKLMEQNLELARRFLLEIIKNPQKIKNIPSGATIVLYPVKI